MTELYLATLNRRATEEELQIATAAFNAPDATRQSATEDVFWSLLNSAEFVLNHSISLNPLGHSSFPFLTETVYWSVQKNQARMPSATFASSTSSSILL